MEGAKIHAENSIRQKNQALNYRRMSARVDAVASRVQTALTTKQVTERLMWNPQTKGAHGLVTKSPEVVLTQLRPSYNANRENRLCAMLCLGFNHKYLFSVLL